MTQAETCRVPGVIVISRKTGEIRMEWEDVPVAAVDAWCQRMARAWDTCQNMRNAGETPENERRDEHVQRAGNCL